MAVRLLSQAAMTLSVNSLIEDRSEEVVRPQDERGRKHRVQ